MGIYANSLLAASKTHYQIHIYYAWHDQTISFIIPRTMTSSYVETPCGIVGRQEFSNEKWDAQDKHNLAFLGNTIIKCLAEGKPQNMQSPHILLNGQKGRVIMYDWDQTAKYIENNSGFYFVGFFGSKRVPVPQEMRELIEEDDKHIVQESRETSGLLAYASTEMPDGQWCNLVLVNDLSVIDKVFHQPFHKKVALDHSPYYYESVRLHNGQVQGNLDMQDSYTFLSTRYIYYPERGSKPFYCTNRRQAG